MMNSKAFTESQTKLFILSIWLEFSNSVNHDRIQGLNNSKCYILFLPDDLMIILYAVFYRNNVEWASGGGMVNLD